MKKKEIIFFSNVLNPYQKDFLKEISKRIKIYSIFNEKKIKNSPWDLKDGNNIKNISSLNYIDRKKFYIKIIKKYNSGNFLLGGYKIRDIFTILFLSKKYDRKIYFFLEKPKNNIKMGLLLKKIYLRFLLKIFRCNGIFAVGKSAKDYYKQISNKVYNLPYSVNPNKYKKTILNKKKILKFIFIGQLINRKGINTLGLAFEKLNNSNYKNKFILNIVGLGKQKYYIKQLSLKHKNLNYLGFLDQKKLSNVISKNQVLILPSKREGWGVVVNEAMASGLALILNKNMEITKDFFTNKVHGLIINNSKDSLYEKMKYMIKNINKVTIMGKKNYNFFLKSKLNSKNSATFFISKI